MKKYLFSKGGERDMRNFFVGCLFTGFLLRKMEKDGKNNGRLV